MQTYERSLSHELLLQLSLDQPATLFHSRFQYLISIIDRDRYRESISQLDSITINLKFSTRDETQ